MVRTALVTTFLLGLLGLSIWFSISFWKMMPDIETSAHGYIAMFLGIFVSPRQSASA